MLIVDNSEVGNIKPLLLREVKYHNLEYISDLPGRLVDDPIDAVSDDFALQGCMSEET